MTLLRSLTIFLMLVILGCQRTAPPKPIQEYELKGEVVSVDPSAQLATIKHEKIEGWMEAMTMEYPVKDKQEFQKLKPKEQIRAKIQVQGTDYWVSAVTDVIPPADEKTGSK